MDSFVVVGFNGVKDLHWVCKAVSPEMAIKKFRNAFNEHEQLSVVSVGFIDWVNEDLTTMYCGG
jgi:hypothetical protein